MTRGTHAAQAMTLWERLRCARDNRVFLAPDSWLLNSMVHLLPGTKAPSRSNPKPHPLNQDSLHRHAALCIIQLRILNTGYDRRRCIFRCLANRILLKLFAMNHTVASTFLGGIQRLVRLVDHFLRLGFVSAKFH